MNSKQVKGVLSEIKGKVKEEVGHLTGNDKLTAEGVYDQVEGKVQKGLGDLKESVKKKVDSILDGK